MSKYEQINKHNIGAKIYIECIGFDYSYQTTEVYSGTFIELNNETFKFKDCNGYTLTFSINSIKSIYKPGEKIL